MSSDTSLSKSSVSEGGNRRQNIGAPNELRTDSLDIREIKGISADAIVESPCHHFSYSGDTDFRTIALELAAELAVTKYSVLLIGRKWWPY